MIETKNPAADGRASGAPNGLRLSTKDPSVPQRQRRKQAAAAKPRRRSVSPEMWSTLRAAQAREHQSLPPDSPRLKPTLPKLRWLELIAGS
jgi:hypothetical protein